VRRDNSGLIKALNSLRKFVSDLSLDSVLGAWPDVA